ncbi:hypothetical protein [Roseateles sp.]
MLFLHLFPSLISTVSLLLARMRHRAGRRPHAPLQGLLVRLD